jgi:hypothetical protein
LLLNFDTLVKKLWKRMLNTHWKIGDVENRGRIQLLNL